MGFEKKNAHLDLISCSGFKWVTLLRPFIKWVLLKINGDPFNPFNLIQE